MKMFAKAALLGTFAAGMMATGCGANPAAMKVKVEEALNGPAAQLVICYQKELLKDRNLKGIVEAKFTVVKGTKEIKEVSVVSSTVNNPALEQCVVENVAKLAFPIDPKVNLAVIWPFEFSPIN